MKKITFVQITLLISFLFFGCSTNKKNVSQNEVTFIQHKTEKRVDVLVDNKPFTSFLYTDTIPDLTKPVLYPVISAGGSTVTRGFPLELRPGERTDHPHHIGMWFTYGDVNHIDFWGNSSAIPPEQKDRMGWIRNTKIEKVTSGQDSGSMTVSMDWLDASGHAVLKENTRFVFQAGADYRTIDRITTLTAQEDTVIFYDTKEGMMGIRVNRALELPSDKPVVLSDEHGNKTEVAKLDNTGVTGNYLNSEGVTGYDVWGKRAKWVALSGKINNENISVIIFDHPDNVGYPSYWHARGYGLFAINPLGQKTFSNGKEELNFTLNPGQSVTFKYRVLIKSGHPDTEEINKEFDLFSKE
ncbi:MAG: hypothetical protein GXO83_07255 [Chlorobi bacterium]|nr:hypothetical protein [Chlorobiota bacterium]